MSKILLVDDEQDIVETTKFILEAIGYECLTAFNGLDAWKLILKETPDLVLLDGMMPIMDGTEVLEKIRESSALKQIPVIMLTAISESTQVKNIMAHRVTDYIVKPFDKDLLIKKVKNILGEPQKPTAITQEEDINLNNS